MSNARELTLTFFITIISPEAKSLCSQIDFFCGFLGVKVDFFFTYAGCSFSG